MSPLYYTTSVNGKVILYRMRKDKRRQKKETSGQFFAIIVIRIKTISKGIDDIESLITGYHF
jgi:hypothetical protein